MQIRQLIAAGAGLSLIVCVAAGLIKPASASADTEKAAQAKARVPHNESSAARGIKLITPPAMLQPKPSRFRGWDYLVSRLLEHGVNEGQLIAAYQNSRMPRFEPIPFAVRPRESVTIYRDFRSPARIKIAAEMLKRYANVFKGAERSFGVSRTVIAAILLIESQFGANTGSSSVIVRLSRVASVAEPANISYNYQRLLLEDPQVTLEAVQKRAIELEQLFLPELPALFEIARRRSLDPHSIKGSIAGAFGYPQFLPTSYLRFALDGNRDRVVSLYSMADAIYSVGNFLHSYGWKDELPREAKRKVVWHYNRSDPYVDAVLDVADQLAGAY